MKNLIRRFALIMMVMGMSCAFAAAQQVKGTVKDVNGQPVIGAAVLVQGTAMGTTSDIDGSFLLSGVPSDAVLEVSSIGYQTLTVPVQGRAFLDLVLEEDALLLDDVVVVGYGVQKKSVVTASIAKVSADELSTTAPLRMDNALKGLAAGVAVTSSSGQPGAAARIRIRGTGTINNSDPLYIVDGMPIEGGIDYLNPSDIESMEVLKDAASGAVYGARAANGVILVTTKKGTGRTKVSYNFTYGFSSPWRERDVLNATEYAIMMNEGRINAGMTPLYADPYSYGEGTDWQKEVFNYNAPSQNHEVSVSGASEKVNYYLSFGYNDQEGIVGGNYGRSNYQRTSVRSNTTFTLFDNSEDRNWLNKATLGSNISYAYIKSTGIATNSTWGSPLGSALALSPILGVYATEEEAQGYLDVADYVHMYSKDGKIFTLPGADYNEMVNPVASLSLPGSVGWSHKVVSNFNVELQIWDGLKFRSSFGADLSFYGSDGYTPVYYLGTNNKATYSSASSESDRGLVWQLENILTYNKTIGKNTFSILLGQSMKESSGNYLGASARYLKDYNKPYLDYSDSIQENGDYNAWGAPYAKAKLASYFFRANYNYDERYMAEVTVRRDGSSRFGANHKWGTFPSFSLGWNIHKEPYINMPHWFNTAKVRFSWGQNGNENIGDFRYTVLTSSNNNYIFGTDENVTIGTKASGLANPDLHWETSTQTDVGIDLGFFANSLTFTVDWFKKVTTDMLMEMNIPTYVGESKPIGNVGVMNNSGVEMELGYKYSKGDWNFRVNGNLSYLRNRLIEYGNESGWANLDSFQGTGAISRAQNGMPFPYFYGYKTDGIFQNMEEVNSYRNADGELIMPDAVPGDVRFVDVDGDGKITTDDRTYIGDGTPDWTWGLNLNLSWKGIDLSMLWQGTIGNDVYDATRRNDISKTNLPSYMLNRWTGEGTSNKYPRFVLGDSVNWQSSDLMVYDGSYVRLKNIQLGYTLPERITKKIFISKLRVFVAAENLLTLTKYHGYDPEISSGGTSLGIDYGVYPQARTFSFGVNVAF
ncbi:MAG: SusC/RagA family TonB-linked outer membrane protein [Candidatus Cryptobacteroides sp.]